MCNWLSKLFGGKCCCKPGEDCCSHKDGQPTSASASSPVAPVAPVAPVKPQEDNAKQSQ